MKVFHLLLLLLTLLTACGRDPETGPYQVCRMAGIRDTGTWGYTKIFAFNSENLAVKREDWTKSDEKSQETIYEYKGAKLVTLTEQIFHGREFPKQRRFQQLGNKIYDRGYDPAAGGYVPVSLHIQTLDKNGHLTGEEFNWIDDHGQLIPRGKNEYKTDEWGNIIEAKYLEGDIVWGIETFEYDDKKNLNLTLPEYTILKTSRNNVISGTYTTHDGLIRTFNTRYTYNAEGYPVSCSDGRMFSYECK